MAFATVWTKYMPVIKILLKKAVVTEQVLTFNRSDFERAAGIKKSGYRFVVNFTKDRPVNLFSGNDIVQAFIRALLDDAATQARLSENDYTFSFSSKYQLQIKTTGLPKQALLPEVAEEIAAN